MTTRRRQHSGEFKAKVVPGSSPGQALEAIRGERTINEIAAEYGVHPIQITQWKKVAPGSSPGQALEALPKLFSSRRGSKEKEGEALRDALYQQIGQLKVELDWLEKKVGHLR